MLGGNSLSDFGDNATTADIRGQAHLDKAHGSRKESSLNQSLSARSLKVLSTE